MKVLLRSLLFVPGNKLKLLTKAALLPADVLIYDLEDSVPLHEKKIARRQVSEALGQLGDSRIKAFVRVNSSKELYIEDLKEAVTNRVCCVCLPKVERLEQVLRFEKALSRLERQKGIAKGSIKIVPLIESALGILNAHQIARCSSRITLLSLGGEDLTLNLQISRTREGHELLFARQMIIFSAAAAGIPAIDTIFTDFMDAEGFLIEAKAVRQLGFYGKLLIHPNQIELSHKVFSPAEEEVNTARTIVEAFDQALEKGDCMIAVEGKMVGLPVVERARHILKLAWMSKKQ